MNELGQENFPQENLNLRLDIINLFLDIAAEARDEGNVPKAGRMELEIVGMLLRPAVLKAVGTGRVEAVIDRLSPDLKDPIQARILEMQKKEDDTFKT